MEKARELTNTINSASTEHGKVVIEFNCNEFLPTGSIVFTRFLNYNNELVYRSLEISKITANKTKVSGFNAGQQKANKFTYLARTTMVIKTDFSCVLDESVIANDRTPEQLEIIQSDDKSARQC